MIKSTPTAWLDFAMAMAGLNAARGAEHDHSIELGKRFGAVTRKTDLAQFQTAADQPVQTSLRNVVAPHRPDARLRATFSDLMSPYIKWK